MAEARPVRLFCAAIGSHGDVHPPIAIALAARALGAEMTLGVAAQDVDKVRAAGLTAVPVGDKISRTLEAQNLSGEDIARRALRDPAALNRTLLGPVLLEACRAIDAALDGHDLLLGTPFGFAAALVAETRRLPYVPLLLQPPRSAVLGPVRLGLERSRLRNTLGPVIDEVRAAGGLPPMRATPPFDFDATVPFRLGLFPRLFEPPPEPRQPPLVMAGAWRFDSDSGAPEPLDAELRAFLQAGAPPVLATLGTAVDAVGDAFFRAALAAGRANGRRVLLVAGRGWSGPTRGEDFIVVRYAPYRTVFPLCAAVVHHGGMGTLTFALEAVRPQVIVPVAFDQPGNAEMARRRGLASVVPVARLDGGTLARALGEALRRGVTTQMHQAGATIARERGPEVAARHLIAAAQRHRPARTRVPWRAS